MNELVDLPNTYIGPFDTPGEARTVIFTCTICGRKGGMFKPGGTVSGVGVISALIRHGWIFDYIHSIVRCESCGEKTGE